MIVSIIVAVSENGVIGVDNTLPWHLGADLKRFKSITTGHTIVMGRKTYDSIGRPLPNRRNVILSRSVSDVEGCEVISSVDDIDKLGLADDDELIVIGGASVYSQFMDRADRLYLTVVHASVQGDAFFPEFDKNQWVETFSERHEADEKNDHDFSFVNFERKKS